MIVIMGINPMSHNRGLVAMSMGMIDLIRKNFPAEKISIISFFSQSNPNLSFYKKRYQTDKNIKIIECSNKPVSFMLNLFLRSLASIVWKILKCLKIDIQNIISRNEILRSYIEADIVISHTAGDRLTDQRPYSYFLEVFMEYIIPIMLNKTIILSPQTIGPFNTLFGRLAGKFILNHSKIICVREKNSLEYLKAIGIPSQKIFLVPDLAFIFQPSPSQDIENALRENNVNITTPHLVGVSLRHMVKHQYLSDYEHQKYVKTMSAMIEYVIERFDASVVIVPQLGFKKPYRLHLKEVTDEVIKNVKNKDRVYNIEKREYPAEVLKGIIGKCDLFVGTFMHANIASLSMCVPTVALSYGYKFEGIMEYMGQKKYVSSVYNINFEDLISKVEDAWNNKEKIKKELKERNYELKKELAIFVDIIKSIKDDTKIDKKQN